MKKKRFFLILLAVMLLFTACGDDKKTVELETETESEELSEIQEVEGDLDLPEGGSGIDAILQAREESKGAGLLPEMEEPAFLFSEEASWIWDGSNDNDTWMSFRKQVSLTEEEAKSAVAHISADSKYRLYINGEVVVREGGVKRGMSPDSSYYDTVDLTGKLATGDNTIAVLAWYFGPSASIGYRSSKKAAFLMQLDLPGKTIATDGTWKVRRNPAFLHDDESNHRLPESDVCYHAAEDDGWLGTDYNDEDWAQAEVRGAAGDDPWGKLISRPIPDFVFEEEKEFEDLDAYRDASFEEETTLTFRLPANIQFVPCFSVVGDPGEHVIRIKTDTWQDNNGNSVMLKYVTKEGEQTFESPAWLSGEKVYVTISPGIRIQSLGYRETHYDSEFAGSFTCSDPFFDKLWKQAQRTLYVNMRDTFMDCPNRERAQWFADAALEMELAACSMDKKALKLYKSAVLTTINSPQGKAFANVEPCNEDQNIIPSQILMGFSVLYDYYLYTGDIAFLQEVYEPVKKYLLKWKVKKSGHVEYPFGGHWQWGDSTPWTDYPLIISGWYRMDMQVMDKLAEVLGREEDRTEYQERAEKIKNGFRKNYMNEEGVFISEPDHSADERVQALAVLTGIYEEDEYGNARGVFQREFENGESSYPLLEYYVEKACFKIGNPSLALKRIKERYGEMVEGENAMSTLWEYWVWHQGTANHAWSGGPLVLLTQQVAGIRPLSPGYETFVVEPQPGKLEMGGLESFEASVSTAFGEIRVSMRTEGEKQYLTVTAPQGTTGEVIPAEGMEYTIAYE